MSQKERDRLVALAAVKSGQLSLREAAPRMGLSYRQARRVWRRYREGGDAGLVHGLRGRPSNNLRSADARRDQALALYRERYAGLGPTLAAEQLARREDLVVDHETLRGWLIGAGLWKPRRDRSRRHRRWRERKAGFGELVQLDGSDHPWLGEDRPRCTLMVMVDDATGWTWAQLFEAETTAAAMSVLRDWTLQHGLPGEIYPDRHSIHRQSSPSAKEHYRRTGRHLPTQFGRALEELGVALSCANSAQAKGRVERMNRTLQDRLVTELALERITTIAAANAYLREVYLPMHNARFAAGWQEVVDVHRPAPSVDELDGALCHKEQRSVGKDGCVQYLGRWLQILPGHALPRRRPKVEVREHLDGQLELVADGVTLPHEPLPQRPTSSRPRPTLVERVASHQPPWRPPADHPFRRSALAAGGGGGSSATAGGELRCGRTRCARSPSAPPPTRGQGTVLLG